MRRSLVALLLVIACDPQSVTPREAADVPWPSVNIEAEVEPLVVGKVLEECLAAADPASVDYSDEAPDGDDQQTATLCVTWTEHLDMADCVRRALLANGGTVVP